MIFFGLPCCRSIAIKSSVSVGWLILEDMLAVDRSGFGADRCQSIAECTAARQQPLGGRGKGC